MKSRFKSRVLTVFTAVVICFTALFGLFSAGKTVFAADDTAEKFKSDLNISAEVGENRLKKDEVFQLKLVLTTIRTETYWSSIDVRVGPLNAARDDYDFSIAQKLKIATTQNGKFKIDYGDFPTEAYIDSSSDRFGFEPIKNPNGWSNKPGCVYISLAYNRSGGEDPHPSEKPVTVTIDIQVLEDVDADEVTFGIVTVSNDDSYNQPNGGDAVVFGGSNNKDYLMAPNPIGDMFNWTYTTFNEAVIRLKPAVYLTALHIGTSENSLTNLDLTAEPITYKLDEDLKQVYLKPEFSDDTISSFAIAGDEDDHTVINHNQVKPVVIKSGNIIKLTVMDLKGNELQTVEIQLAFSSVRLSGLTALAGTAEMTNTGLQGTFNGEVFAYTVKVPADSAKAVITASVPDDGEASKSLTLHSDGCTAPAAATDGTEFEVTEITDDSTLTITVNSQDGILSKTYEITFVHVSTDTGITSFTLRRSDRIYQNDKTKLEENECDYYFEIAEEEGCSAIIAVAEGATYKVTGLNGGLYTEGEYTVTVTAEAGNSREYKVKVAVAEEEPSFKFYYVLKPVDYVVESVSFTAVNCFYFPFRIINIVLWDVIVAIFG